MRYGQTILPHYTFEDLVRWEGNWELIEGIPIALVPLPPPRHQLVRANMNTILHFALKETSGKKYFAYPAIAYMVADDTIVQPDISIVLDKIEKDYLDFPPALVVEILSPVTALWDRHTKFEIYRSQGVKYYLIVDADKETIEIYYLINEEYQLQPFSNSFSFVLDEGCEITPDFTEIW